MKTVGVRLDASGFAGPLRQIRGGLADTARDSRRAESGLAALANQARRIDGGLASLANQSRTAGRGLAGLAAGANRAGKGLADLAGRATTAAGALAKSARQSLAAARAKDRLAGSAKRSAGALATLTSRAREWGVTMAVVAGGLAVFGTVNVAAGFESQMSAVEAITGATGDTLAALSDRAKEMGESTVFSARQSGEGLEYLARAGFGADEAIAAIKPSLDLAVAGVLDLGRSADIVSNIVSTFNREASYAGVVADVLAKGASSSNTNVEQLGQALKFVGPVAAAVGRSLEETTAAIGVLSDRGIQADMAGTGLRRILQGLIAPTDKARGALESYGLSVEDVSPATNSLVEILEKLQGISIQHVFDLFAQRGGTAFLALRSGIDSLRELEEGLIAADGTSQRMADTMADNLAGAGKMLVSVFESVQIAAGEGATPALRAMAERLREVLAASRDGMAGVGEAAGGLAIVATETGLALGTLAQGVGDLLGLLDTLSGGLLGAATSSGVLGKGIAALIAFKVGAWLASATAGMVGLRVAAAALVPWVGALTAAFAVGQSLANDWATAQVTAMREITAASAPLRTAEETFQALLESSDLTARTAAVERYTDEIAALAEREERVLGRIAKAREAVAAADAAHEASRGTHAQVEASVALAEAREEVERLTRRHHELRGARGLAIRRAEQLEAANAKLATSTATVTDEEAKLQAENEELQRVASDAAEGVGELTGAFAQLQAQLEEQQLTVELMRQFRVDAELAASAARVLLSEGGDGQTRIEVIRLAQALAEAKAEAEALGEGLATTLPPVEDIFAEGELGPVQPFQVTARVEGPTLEVDEADEWAHEQKGLIELLATEWQDFGYAVVDVLSMIDEGLGRLAAGVLRVIDGLDAVQAAAASGDRFGAAVAGFQVGSTVGGMGRDLGLWQGDRGTSQFGGQMSGDYGELGASLGGALGGALGMSAGPVGAAVGTMIGSVLGGVVGGAIKRGADEGLGTLRQVGDDVALDITKSEGGLGSVVQQVGDAVAEAIERLEVLLGTQISIGAGGIGIKVRDEHIIAFANGLRAEFDEMADAVGWIVVQALKSAEFGELPPEVERALANSGAETMEELEAALETAFAFRRLDIGEVQAAIEQTRKEFEALWRDGMALVLDPTPLIREFNRVDAAMRDSILGIVETAEERIRREAAAYNAQIPLQKAWIETKRVELLALRASIQARGSYLQAMGGELEVHVRGAQVLAEVAGVAGAAYTAHAQAMAAAGSVAVLSLSEINAALDALDSIDLRPISEQEILDAIRRANAGAGGGGGGLGASQAEQRAERRAELLRDVEILREGYREQTIAALDHARETARIVDEMRQLGIPAEVIEAYEALRRQERLDQIQDGAREVLARDGESEPQTRLREITERYDQALEALAATVEDEAERAALVDEQLAARAAEIRALTAEVIDGLGLPMESLRDRVDQLSEALAFLRQQTRDGVLSLGDLVDVLHQVQTQAEAELLGMAAGLLETMGMDQEAAELRARTAELEFHLTRMQFEYLATQYEALGLLTGELRDRVRELLGVINDPDNWPDFAPVETTPAATPRQTPTTTASGPDPADALARWRDQLARFAGDDVDGVLGDAARLLDEHRTLVDGLAELRVPPVVRAQLAADLAEAWDAQRSAFLDDALDADAFARLDVDALRQHFRDLWQAVDQLGLDSAANRIRLVEAEAAAWDGLWERATQGFVDFADGLERDDPRRRNEDVFVEARDTFRALVARAQSGDLEAVEQLRGAAEQYRAAAADYLGAGGGAVTDEILAARDALGEVDAGELLGGELAEPTVAAIDRSTLVLEEIRDRLDQTIAQTPADRRGYGASSDAGLARAAADAFARQARRTPRRQGLARLAPSGLARLPRPTEGDRDRRRPTPPPPPAPTERKGDRDALAAEVARLRQIVEANTAATADAVRAATAAHARADRLAAELAESNRRMAEALDALVDIQTKSLGIQRKGARGSKPDRTI